MLIIMQGVPGSGKSTFAQKLEMAMPAIVCSTDNYFLDENNKYIFDKTKLAENHKSNQNHVETLLMQYPNENINVIVDNTNLKNYEIKPYVHSAIRWGHEIVIIRCTGNHQNIHGISEQQVEFMRQQMEDLSVEKALIAIAPWEI